MDSWRYDHYVVVIDVLELLATFITMVLVVMVILHVDRMLGPSRSQRLAEKGDVAATDLTTPEPVVAADFETETDAEGASAAAA